MAGSDNPEHEALRTSLDHAWAWYNIRFGQYMQLLNFALLAFAVFSAAYVTALSSNLHAVASGVGIVGTGASLAVAYAGKIIQHRADLAQPPLTEIQDRLAHESKIESLRMFAAAQTSAHPIRSRHLADTALTIMAAVWLTAAVYPLMA